MAKKTEVAKLDPSLVEANKAIAVIEKTIPGVKIFNLADETKGLDIERHTTGSFQIDAITGGGLPFGRIIELYGPESSGKTSVNLIMAAAYTRDKMPVLFIDAEHAFDKVYAENLGVDMSYMYVVQPDFGEQGFSILEGAVKSGTFPFIIVDSVAAMVPKVLIESDLEATPKIGAHAALMSRGLGRLVANISNSKTTVSFINQTRVKIGGFAPGMSTPMDTTGGKAMKFYASIRIDVRRGQDIKRKDLKIGQEIKVRTIKNKTFPPFKETLVNLMLDPDNNNWGIDPEVEIFNIIIDKDMVGSRQSYITLRGVKIRGANGVSGKDNLWAYLKENQDEFDYLIKKVKANEFTIETIEGEAIEGFKPKEILPPANEGSEGDESEEEESNLSTLTPESDGVDGILPSAPVSEEDPEFNFDMDPKDLPEIVPATSIDDKKVEINIPEIIESLTKEGETIDVKDLVAAAKAKGGKITWAKAKEALKEAAKASK